MTMIQTNEVQNNQNNQLEETMLQTTINEQTVKKVIKEFKQTFNDKSQRKQKKRMGTICYIVPGTLQFEHFVFYRMLKGLDFKKATHSTDSEKYQELMKELKNAANYEYTLYMVKSLKKVFPSLKEEEIKQIILKALEDYAIE